MVRPVALLALLAVGCVTIPTTQHPIFQPHVYARASTVRITSTQYNGWCGGVVFAPKLIATVAHCLVSDLTIDGQPASLVGVTPVESVDLAVLTADIPNPPAQLGAKPVPGALVVVIGYGPVTLATIYGTYEGEGNIGLYQSPRAIFSDVRSFEGLSGSPIFDAEGRLVSINQCYNAKYNTSCGASYQDLQEMFLRFGGSVIR